MEVQVQVSAVAAPVQGGTGSGGTSGGSGSIQTTIAKRAIAFDAQAQSMPQGQLSNGSSVSVWSGAGYYLRGAVKSIVNTASGVGNLLAISQPGSVQQLEFDMAISHPRQLWNAIRSENERNVARAATDPRFFWEQQGQTDMTALLLLAPYADILKALGIAGDAARAGEAANGAGQVAAFDAKFAATQLLQGGKISISRLRQIIPQGAQNMFKSTSTIINGEKYVFNVNGTRMEIRWHSPDSAAAAKYPGSNSGSMWTAQIKIGNKWLGADGNFYKNPDNITHIPVMFGR